MVEVPVKIYVTNVSKKAREAAPLMALLPTTTKDRALLAIADRLAAEETAVMDANLQDVETVGKNLGREAAREVVERVRLQPESIKDMAETLRRIASQPDPVGEITSIRQQENGLQVRRVRAPIGVIGVISEYGPQMFVEAVALCLKAGCVCVYRGPGEWMHTNTKVATILHETAEAQGVPTGALLFLDRPDKEAALELMKQTPYLDAIIARGGAGLRRVVTEQARVPILCHDGGVSYVYIDAEADLPLSQNMVINSKVQQASASNSLDTLLVHQSIGRMLLPGLIRRLLDEFKVEVRACPKTVSLTGAQEFSSYKSVKAAQEEDWSRQFLAPIMAVKIVKDAEEALAHVARYGPAHTLSIVTRDYPTAMRFAQEVDAGAVLVNASTRLHDGAQFGLGGQIGFSTLRSHVRGAISLEDLTCQRYVAFGTGQLRHPHPIPIPYEDAIMLKRPS